jgi:hypothetical protein
MSLATRFVQLFAPTHLRARARTQTMKLAKGFVCNTRARVNVSLFGSSVMHKLLCGLSKPKNKI